MPSIEAVVEELYGAPPAGFTQARDAAARAARDRGQRDLARAIGALRKPTVAAWLVNLLVRDDPALAESLPELGDQLRQAARSLSGPELRALAAQRQQLVARLVARARRLAAAAGQRPGESTLAEVEATLLAALADPDVAAEVVSGRLVNARHHEGFGPAPLRAPPSKADPSRRAAAQAALRAAETAGAAAAQSAEQARSAAAEARETADRLRAQLVQAEREAQAAADRAEAAERAAADARLAVRRARAAVHNPGSQDSAGPPPEIRR